jgi:hypothetical protein
MLIVGLFSYLREDTTSENNTHKVIKSKKRSRNIPIKYNNYKGYKSSGYFNGGKVTTGLYVHSVRWHKHDGFERLVLDITGAPDQYMSVVGTYNIGTEATNSTSIAGELTGYGRFTSNIPDFKHSDIIYYMEASSDSYDSQFFSISLKTAITYKVFSLPDPARIVIDMKIR